MTYSPSVKQFFSNASLAHLPAAQQFYLSNGDAALQR